MYRVQPEPEPEITLENGSTAAPLLSLQDDYLNTAHIIEDDHCYVLCVPSTEKHGKMVMTPWWFPEAFEAARTLPLLTHG
jgi:hypothetical protein